MSDNTHNLTGNLSSRVHRLNNFPKEGVDCYVKRDDELSCGISGSKLRKYSSLMPYLMEQGIKHLIIIAGPQSNNLLAALQMAREFQLEVKVFLLRPYRADIKGNFKISLLFLEQKDIVWVARENWFEVENIAKAHCATMNEPAFILSEGASVSEAMPGALSIAKDILDNERALGIRFDHIFVDAGTGFSAIALIKGLQDCNHQAMVHVVLLADTELVFKHKLLDWVGSKPNNYRCYLPQTAKAFGAVNASIMNEIKRVAKEEGILLDPIYSAKLFHESRARIVSDNLKGNVLIIHSGGVLSLAGFEFN